MNIKQGLDSCIYFVFLSPDYSKSINQASNDQNMKMNFKLFIFQPCPADSEEYRVTQCKVFDPSYTQIWYIGGNCKYIRKSVMQIYHLFNSLRVKSGFLLYIHLPRPTKLIFRNFSLKMDWHFFFLFKVLECFITSNILLFKGTNVRQ